MYTIPASLLKNCHSVTTLHSSKFVNDLDVLCCVCQESSMSFFVTLQSNFQHVMMYESPELQQKARSHIPHQQLFSAAEQKLKEATEVDSGASPTVHSKESVLYLYANQVILNAVIQRNQLTCFTVCRM